MHVIEVISPEVLERTLATGEPQATFRLGSAIRPSERTAR